MNNSQQCIAYLAPEIPGLSSTFVYNEILALENKGYSIVPVSVHRPVAPAEDMRMLADRTFYLYSVGIVRFFLSFLSNFFTSPVNLYKSSIWLFSDIRSIGCFKRESISLVYQFIAANHLARILKKKNCRHLHIHFAHVPAQIGMYASKISGVPYSITSHANDIFQRGLLLKTKAERSSCFATISEFNKKYLISVGVPENKIKVIRCGVDFNKSNSVTKREREEFTIGSLGRLVEKKGMSTLIQAVKQLKDIGYEINLEIAGDGPLKNELEKLSSKLGLNNQVFFHGAVEHSKVSEWLQNLDAFVLACVEDSNGDMDGIPVSLMEAMSHDLAVISSDLSGIPELIIHNKTGLLAMPGKPDSLARQIKKLISDIRLREKLGEMGHEHVISEFSEDINIKRLEHCFNA